MLRRTERYISCRRLLDRFITLATHENWSSFKLHPTESPFHAGQTYPASMKISLLLIRCLLLHLRSIEPDPYRQVVIDKYQCHKYYK